ncbi:MAG: ATP-binding protein, partial [Deltaproteobacteria bacterium]|nr:ATP-binding protein [Deltaproteobacteria bacterium]
MRDKLLFNICPDGEFFGRAEDIEYICRKAADTRKAAPNILLTGRRWIGKTEVLRRVHYSLFWTQARVVPVYYQFKGYGSAWIFAEDFLKEVVKQYLAFRTRNSEIVRAEFSTEKLERMLVDNEAFDLADFLARHREAKKSDDLMAALRNAVSTPDLISSAGLPIYLILDDIDRASRISIGEGGPGIMKELMEVLNSGTCSYLASSSDRKGLEGWVLNGSNESMELAGLGEDLAVSMMTDLCRQYGIEFDTEILDIGARKLDGNPMYIKNVIWAAHRAAASLVKLKDFVDIYSSELVDGNIGCALRSSIRLKGLNGLRVLHACASTKGATSEEELTERNRCPEAELKEILEGLCSSGLLEASLGSIRWAADDVVRDFVSFVYETRVRGRSIDEVRTSFVRDGLKEGYTLKGSKVRGRFKDEVVALIKAFNGQKTSKLLFRNHLFSARLKNGAVNLDPPVKGEDELALPQTIGCFDTVRLEKNETGTPIFIAQGFQNGRYDSGNEVIWVVGIKDSVSPVNLGDVENFIRRYQILRENFRIMRVVKWLVGREGFTSEAAKRLDGEGVWSSDSVQVQTLKGVIEEKAGAGEAKAATKFVPNKEFELILPMSTKSELVAVKAAEEIGTEMG